MMTDQNDPTRQHEPTPIGVGGAAPRVKAPVHDIMDVLVQALAYRIKDVLMEEIMETISKNLPLVEAESIEGLDRYIQHAIEENDRHGDRKIDADDVEGLDEYIKETLKQATISIDI